MSTAAILDRLKRDGHLDLVAAVHARAISAHSAGILAGYTRRKPTRSAPGVDPRSKRRLAAESMIRGRR
jgi:hypothetical protein